LIKKAKLFLLNWQISHTICFLPNELKATTSSPRALHVYKEITFVK